MASIPNVLICAGLALVLYSCLGLPLAARFASRPLAVMMAPALGWAVHSAAALALFFIVGMTRLTIVAAFVVPAVAAVIVMWRDKPAIDFERVFALAHHHCLDRGRAVGLRGHGRGSAEILVGRRIARRAGLRSLQSGDDR